MTLAALRGTIEQHVTETQTMLNELSLGPHFEAFIKGQLEKGRYADASEVVRDALGLLERREEQTSAIDESVTRGLADIAAGRVHELDAVFDEIEAELASPSPKVG